MTHGYNRDGGPFNVPPSPVSKPSKSGRGWKIGLTALLATIALCVFGTVAVVLSGGDGAQRIELAQPTASSTGADVGKAAGRAATSAPVTAPREPVGKVTLTDGTWEVGTEAQPGTYATTVSSDGFGCGWSRLRNFDGNLNAIIANDFLVPGSRGRFTIKKSDRGVELMGGCTWERQ